MFIDAIAPARLRAPVLRLPVLLPGFTVAAVVAVAAQFISEHYGAPAMLMALLLGMTLQFLSLEGRCVEGIGFTARHVLRLGVALLGARISVELLLDLGAGLIGLIVAAVAATILLGFLAGRALGKGWRFGLLTGGAVAICGASAAMAIAAVLPRDENSETDLSFTVLGVTLLSTLAMIAYPLLTGWVGFDTRTTGVFLGATIHDVAQVVGAGFSISPEAGETATLVKLIRVSLLAPVVLLFSLAIRAGGLGDSAGGKRPPLIPGFVLGFLALGALNSLGLVPEMLGGLLADASGWALLIAIAAVGMKTSLATVMQVGGAAIALIAAETLFLAGIFLTAL
ncbi:MAG: YeiH family protein [Limimaricola soesokkakensis]|uniref:YeiH family protein n=1 Tax=Limimaricola soesokkakensis TaxID=1343159 RepID=UPI004057EB2B